MYPPILMLYPPLAKSIITYRLNRLDAAAKKALSYKRGWKGYMFPWESAFSGVEVKYFMKQIDLIDNTNFSRNR